MLPIALIADKEQRIEVVQQLVKQRFSNVLEAATSLIQVNPLKMVLLREVTVKIRRSSMTRKNSEASEICERRSEYGILTTTI